MDDNTHTDHTGLARRPDDRSNYPTITEFTFALTMTGTDSALS
jgi:hypothetical protein